jgi:hypothetical protein
MRVGGIYLGEDGAAVVGGGDMCPPLEVLFQLIGAFHMSYSSCSSSEDVVQFAEVEAIRRDGEVEVLRFSGEYIE